MINNYSRDQTIVYKMYFYTNNLTIIDLVSKIMVQIEVMYFYTNNLTIVTRKMI